MKLLSAKTATTTTNLGLSGATCVAVYCSAISIISIIQSDGTEGASDGTVQGSVTLPAGSLTKINKDTDQFIRCDKTNGTYTAISPNNW